MDRIRLFVLLDGVGWRHVQHTDFLEGLCPHRKPLKTVLGYSCAAVPTILSGKMPAETDRWGMWYYSPGTSPFRGAARLVRLPRGVRRLLGITREWIVSGFKERHGIGGYCHVYQIPDELLPLVDTCAKRSWYQPNSMERCDSIFGAWTRARLPYHVVGYPLADTESLSRALTDLRQDPRPLYFLHLYETDAFLHRHCNDLEAFRGALRPYAEQLEALYRAAREASPAVDLCVFSDHGMTPVVGEYDLMPKIEGLGLRVGHDYVPLYDSTMARLWFLRPAAEGPIRQALQGLSCGRILSEAELRRLGVYFPNGRYGELIFLMNPGWVINPCHMGGVAPPGMHGYHPEEDPWADAMLLASRPIPEGVTHIAHLFSLMQPHDSPPTLR